MLSRGCENVANGFYVIFVVGGNFVCFVGNMVQSSGLMVHNIRALKLPD